MDADAEGVRGRGCLTNRGVELYQQARKRIPGGTQLLSKRPEMFLPDQWPAYYSRASGAEIWDMDGRRLIDMTIGGIGACVLGYADPDVDDAVREAIGCGVATSLNCPEEPALADLLCELHPWADMVRYLRCGGEAMAAGVRIARARTRKDKIVFCGYHGWHDWYLAANLAQGSQLDGHLLPGLDPAGVPRALAGTAIPFSYNDVSGLEKALAAAGDDLAAIVMEPMRATEPAPGFLERVRDEAHRRRALLVFDEVSAGFRLNTGGTHLTLGVNPDIAVFAKAIGNGYPMAAVIGTGDAMHAAQDTFVSSTHWTERTGPAAALATLAKHRRLDVGPQLVKTGHRVQAVWRQAAADSGLNITIGGGLPPFSRFSFDYPEPMPIRTLFTQSMLDRGFLAANAFYSMYAHTPDHVAQYGAAVTEVFREIRKAIDAGTVASLLRGPVVHSGFHRLA